MTLSRAILPPPAGTHLDHRRQRLENPPRLPAGGAARPRRPAPGDVRRDRHSRNLQRQAALLHLLSPARRPIQVTADLASFWQNSYPEVKKELKGRYPKHFWPDDPLTAEAVRGVKKR